MGLKPSTIEQAKFEFSPLGKSFNKGLDKDDQKGGFFKRLKNIENAKKSLIGGDDKDKDKKQQQNNNNIDTKPSNVLNYLKSLSQKANDLMDEIEEANDDIDNNKLLFIGSNKEKINFNIFGTPLNLLLDILNGKITLKKAEINQRDLNEKNRGTKM